ncbi:MAG: transposase [Syntrophaceticus sp.]|jgi:REP element-mobilizing transposase RayT|nr:transposase [Syntrophaceticus sp.]MDD4782513.1 transposase [Syntrophaceticus sp.]
MPRAARKMSETGVHHTMVRGINRQDIFQDREDRMVFLEKLSAVKERSECSIYAYCLMSNHVHLLIAEGVETISQIMKRLGSSYAYWYNKKYERVGHLFQGRFRSEPVNVETYLLTALRYIHQNPVKAGIAHSCNNYPWSSYHDYMNPERTAKSLTDTKLGLEIIGEQQRFAEFHQNSCGSDLFDIDDITTATDALAEQLIQQVLANRTTVDLLKMPIPERNILLRELKSLPGVSHRQIERVTGINRNMIQRA